MKRAPAFVTGLAVGLTIVGTAFAAPAVYDQVWGDEKDAEICELDAEDGVLILVRCQPSTTTSTTQPPETSTTTEPSTTTSTSTVTTTTQPPGLVIPPTEPYPARGTVPYKDCGGYDIEAINASTGVKWWVAPYWCADGLPYTDGAAWIDGDREGYRCGYGFITTANGEDFAGDNIVGRFAFVRAPDAAYGKVIDRYMEEAERYLDGTPTPYYGTNFKEIPEEDCTDVRSDIDYANACRDVDERPRVGFFDAAGQILDIRDYSNTDATNVVFNLFDFDGTRATVIACEDGLVALIVYYDAMGDGQLAVELDGAMVSP